MADGEAAAFRSQCCKQSSRRGPLALIWKETSMLPGPQILVTSVRAGEVKQQPQVCKSHRQDELPLEFCLRTKRCHEERSIK